MLKSRYSYLTAAVVLVASLAAQAPISALAAYCGSSADTNAVVALALARGPSDSSRIMDVVVDQDYARVDVQTKGVLTEYYVKDCGRWRYSGMAVPDEAPTAVKNRFANFVTRDNGGTECLNPGFVNHPSGP